MRGLNAHADGETVAHVDCTCSIAIGGRRAARVVSEWAKRFGLTEAEFQLLWRLRSAPESGLDQTSLAGSLAFSPAQISASVERLRAGGHICATGSAADRRRHLWRLSAAGRELLDQLLLAAKLWLTQSGNKSTIDLSGSGGREAAA
jgi:DNA-binding MarR family transcriptional regulator